MNIFLFAVLVFAFLATEILAFPSLYESLFGSAKNDNDNDYDYDYDYDDNSNYHATVLNSDSNLDLEICQSSIVRSFHAELPATYPDDAIAIKMLSECEPNDFMLAGLDQYEAFEFFLRIQRLANPNAYNFSFADTLRNKYRKLKAKVSYKIDSWKSYLSDMSDNVRNYFVRKLKSDDRDPELSESRSESNRPEDVIDDSIENFQLKPDLEADDGNELNDRFRQRPRDDDDDDDDDENENENDDDESRTDDDAVVDGDIKPIDFTTLNSITDEIFTNTENHI